MAIFATKNYKMDQPIAVFDPVRTGNYNVVIICLVFAVLASIFIFFNFKRKTDFIAKRYQQLFSLLAFFILIISLTTGFFSFWAAQKFIPVKVYSDSVETGFGKAAFENIAKVYIHNDQQKSPITAAPQGEITRILIIEEIDRKTHALSEENYNIDSIMQVFKTLKEE
jgi:hypothetical protein